MKKLLALVLVACMILAVGAFSAFADEGDLVGLSMPTKSLERWNRDGTVTAPTSRSSSKQPATRLS